MTTGTMRTVFVGVLGMVASVLLGACGGDERSASVPMLGIQDIGPAVAALREQQDSEPQFFEINSTADGVNLFIAATRSGSPGTPDAVIQGRYTPEDGLLLSEELLDASGPIFTFDDLDLDAGRLLGQVVQELENSTPLMFVLTAVTVGTADSSDPVMRIIVESARGGRLAVFVALDGTILGTEVLEG